MEPNDIISPSGIAPTRVTEKSLSVCKKPVFSAAKTTGNCSFTNIIKLKNLSKNNPIIKNPYAKAESACFKALSADILFFTYLTKAA